MKKIKSNLICKDEATRLYQLKVPIVGLTGGISTGKSTVARILHAKNFPIIDADKLVKSVYQKKEVIEFIQQNFPSAIVANQIDFKILRKVAFSEKINIEKIEQKIYQYLPEAFIAEYQNFNSPSFIIYDVPLLFEKGLDQLVDIKVCVYANREIQLDRLVARDQISHSEAEKILNHQMSIEEKRTKSNFIISNESTQENLINEVEKFLKNILEE